LTAGRRRCAPRHRYGRPSPGVFGLDVVLEVKRIENIVREIDRKLRGIGVERLGIDPLIILLIGTCNIRVFPLIRFGEAIRGPFSRRGFEIVVVPRFLLEQDQTFPHEVEDLLREDLAFR